LAGKTPSQALETWIASLLRAVQSVAQAEVFGSGHTIGAPNSVHVVSRVQTRANTVPLRLNSGESALKLGVFLQYTVSHTPGIPRGAAYVVQTFGYRYEVTDPSGRELFVYHWHPEGSSHIREPHLHILASPFTLLIEEFRQGAPELAIDKAHFPTGQIVLPDVIRLLIEDLGVKPRNADWRRVLDTSP